MKNLDQFREGDIVKLLELPKGRVIGIGEDRMIVVKLDLDTDECTVRINKDKLYNESALPRSHGELPDIF